MCMISEVTIDCSSSRTSEPPHKGCGPHHDEDDVPAVVPMSDEEEGYSSMSEDEEGASSEDESSVDADKSRYHELFLPQDARPYEQPIVFSGGMDSAECEEYYRNLEEHEEQARGAYAHYDVPPTVQGMLRKRKTGEGSLFRRIRREAKKIKSTAEDDNEEEPKRRSSLSSASSSSSSSSSVSFNSSVTVYPVFSISAFPGDVWDRTWTPRRQVKEAKRRAKVEFRYDGCDWRSATEEDGMFRNPRTGLLEHPVHYYDEEIDNRRSGRDEVVQMCLIMPMPGRR